MDQLAQDLRHALAQLGRRPLFALAAVLSLAIGIGANTTIFTVASALLLRPPAGVQDPGRVVDIGRTQEGQGFDNNSYPNYLDVRARSTSFTGVYAARFEPQPMGLSLAGSPSVGRSRSLAGSPDGAERIFGGLVSSNYFETLGTRPAAGRLFGLRDGEQPGGAPFAVLSHRFWARRFESDPTLIGQTIQLNGHAFTVLGVAEEGFDGTSVFRPDLWVPLAMLAQAVPRGGAGDLTSRRSVSLLMGARLKPGVTLETARAELAAIGAALEREFPDENRGRGLQAMPLSRFPGNQAPIAGFVAALMVVVGLVLVIACANVAGVLLSRAAGQRREIAIRLSLGATRGRIVRQTLVETAVLSLAGAALGLVLARLSTALLLAFLPALPVPVGLSPALDLRVLTFTMALSLSAALFAGLAPALHATRGDVAAWLKADAQTAPERVRLRGAFVVTQVALSVVLAVAATLSVRALARAARIDAGFDPRGVEVATLDLALGGYTDETGPLFMRQLLQRLRALPGVRSASVAAVLPLSGSGMGLGALRLPGRTAEEDEIRVDWNMIEPGYFATLNAPLLSGRDFDETDRAGGRMVAIVNETLARRAWPGQDPLGRELRQGTGEDERALTVVAVARDGKYRALGEDARAFIWVPLQQQYRSRLSLVVRSTEGQRLAGELRALIRDVNPALPIVTATSLTEHAAVGLAPQRILGSVSGLLAAVGLLLAMLGVYGVTAFLVASRTREIAVRMALGADRSDVLRLVIGHGMKLVGAGIGAGCLLALGGGFALRSLLLGVAPADPASYAVPIALFCATGLAATYLPARRASGIEAADALRSE